MKRQRISVLFLYAFLLGLMALLPSRVLADDDDNVQDPPSRVARLSYIHGQVSFSPAGTEDWVSSVLNRPMTTGDKLWTDQDSRAELHIGSSVVRLGEMTGFSFLNLDDKITQIRLTEGSINLHVIRLGDGETVEVDTPNLAFNVLRPGHYRINVNEAGDTSIITVRDGSGEVTGGGSAFTLHPGDFGTFSGTDTLSSDVEALPDEDDFDSWCDERDLREEHAVAHRYVPDDVIGYEDLDDYGGWRPVSEYGTVWFPHVAVVGWAPYRYGHWAYIAPWGWTWVDDAPWGFAPFHYGRWVVVGGAWGWVPGPRPVVGVAYVRPVYAPALVAWVGGPHFAVGIGVGGGFAAGVNVGWFPLGPREVFVPSYPVSRTYVTNINVTNTVVERTVVNNYYNTVVVNKTVVNNVTYVNQRVSGAVTVTSPQAFTSAQPVSRNIVAVDQREVATASVAVRAPAAVPPKQAVLGSGAPTNYHPPAAVQARQVVAKTTPPPPPMSFAAHQAAIQKNGGQPISVAQTRQLQTQQVQARATPAPAVKIAPPAKPVTPMYNQQGSRSNNQPGPLNANRPTDNSVPANNSPNRPANAGQNNNAQPGHMDRPPSSRPAPVSNPQLEQQHQQQIQQLQQQHDQEYQQLQQKQAQEQQKLQQQNANQEKQQQLQQRHQQQLEQLQQQHQQQQQTLKQKQETEHNQAKQQQSKAAKDEKHK
jgi:Family of unknown function (DUF6600)